MCCKLQTLGAVSDLYQTHLALDDRAAVLKAVQELVEVEYLEKTLWKLNAVAAAAKDDAQVKTWLLSVLLLANYKCNGQADAETVAFLAETSEKDTEDLGAWGQFTSLLLGSVQAETNAWNVREKTQLVQFLGHCYLHLEIPAIAKVTRHLLALTWLLSHTLTAHLLCRPPSS